MSSATLPGTCRWRGRPGSVPAGRGACASVMLAAVLAVLAPAMPASAQTADGVRAALERTDQALLHAEDLLAEGGEGVAGEHLAQARRLQARARGAFEAGLHRDALRLTTAARRRAATIADRLGRPRDAGPILLVLERTDVLLERTGSAIRECGSETGERAWSAAAALQAQAREALRTDRHGAALSVSVRAREDGLAALRMAEEACGRAPDRARRSVGHTGELLRAAEWLRRSRGPAARPFVAACRLHERAEEALASGRPAEALGLSLRARDQLVRALGRSDRPLAPQAVADAVRGSRERLEAAAARAGDQRGRRLLVESRARQRRAESLLAEGRLAGALAEAKAVASLLDRAGL